MKGKWWYVTGCTAAVAIEIATTTTTTASDQFEHQANLGSSLCQVGQGSLFIMVERRMAHIDTFTVADCMLASLISMP